MSETNPCTEGRDHRFSCCAEHGTHKAEPYGEHGWNCPTSWAERGLITLQYMRYQGKSAALGRTLGMEKGIAEHENTKNPQEWN